MKQSVRVLLTGSSGYLGQHVLQGLLNCPAVSSIDALYRSADGFEQSVQDYCLASNNNQRHSSSVKVQKLDFSNVKDVDTWMNARESGDEDVFDVCVHTAALSSPMVCEEKPAEAQAVNNPTYFFTALYKRNPNMLVIALSTDQVYAGDRPPYRETDSTGPVNVYGQSKLALEQYLSTTVPAVILRSSIILGPVAPISPEKAHTTFVHFIASRQNVETAFFTDERRSVVAVEDVVASILWFITADSVSPGIYNMGGPESLSRMDMAQMVFQHLQYDTKYLIAEKKVDQPEARVKSPLDISMNSSKLYDCTSLSFHILKEILPSIWRALKPE